MPSTVNTAYAYLIGWYDTFKTQYAPVVADLTRRFGRTTRCIPKSTMKMDGNRIEYEFQARPNNSPIASFDSMAPAPDPGPGVFGRFQVVFDHTDPNRNDFMHFDIGFKTTFYDIQKQSDSNFKPGGSTIQKDIREGIEAVKECMSRSFHLPADGALGVISTGGIKNADSDSWWEATAVTTTLAYCMLKLDATSIARIGDGQIIEIRTAAGVLRANNIIVEDVRPADMTIVVRLATASHVPGPSVDANGTPVTTVASFAATDKIYLNGSYNVVPKGSLAAFFSPTTAYFGKNRMSDENYRLLMPQRVNASQAAAGTTIPLTAEMIHAAGQAAAWTTGDGNAKLTRMVVSARDQWNAVSRLQKDNGLTFTPALASDVGRDATRSFGFDGSIFHDPNLGSVGWVVDDFAAFGQIDFLNLEDWEMVAPYGNGGFDMVPGTIAGIWDKLGENDGSGRASLVYAARGLQHFCFVCKKPKNQVRLYNLTPVV